MRKILITALLIPSLVFSQGKFTDTEKHLLAGIGISAVGTFCAFKLNIPGNPFFVGFSLGTVVAFTKEFWDHRFHTNLKNESDQAYFAHVGDIFYTMEGSMVGSLAVFIPLRRNTKWSCCTERDFKKEVYLLPNQ